MADMTFNTADGAAVERKLLILYLNTGTSQSPTWSPIGKRVEDSSMEYDWQGESKRDILGDVHNLMHTPIIKQTFDPCELDGGDAAQLNGHSVRGKSTKKDRAGVIHLSHHKKKK